MATLYTTGNWTIESLYNDSISVPKTVSVPDFDWAHDWHETSKPTGREPGNGVVEKYFGDTTGDIISDVEHMTVNYRNVRNVYDDLPMPVDASSQTRQKNGRAVYRNLTVLYKATNSVSGEEVYFPVKGSVSLQIPAVPLVQAAIIADIKNRLISSLHATGNTGTELLEQEFRRDLDPTR